MCLHRLINIVLDSMKCHVAIFDDCVSGPRVAVPRLANAAGINNLRAVNVQMHGHVSMTDTNEVDIHMIQTLFPLIRRLTHIFVHGIPGTRMDQQELMISNHNVLSDRHPRQPGELFVRQHLKMVVPHRSGDQSKRSGRADQNSLRNRMVMVPTHTVRGVTLDPFHTRYRVGGIIDQIPQKQADIKFLIDGRQGWPVGVNVSNQENTAFSESVLWGLDRRDNDNWVQFGSFAR